MSFSRPDDEYSARLRQLADDWDRFGELSPAAWRDEMRMTIVIELQALDSRMEHECKSDDERADRR